MHEFAFFFFQTPRKYPFWAPGVACKAQVKQAKDARGLGADRLNKHLHSSQKVNSSNIHVACSDLAQPAAAPEGGRSGRAAQLRFRHFLSAEGEDGNTIQKQV